MRERVLAKLPASATLIAVTSGAALGEPEVAAAWRFAAAHVPDTLRCAVEAARTADEAGLALSPAGARVALVRTVGAATCPGLAIDADGVWIASSGVAPGEGALDADRFARARSYLLEAPAAVVAEIWSPRATLVAVAQPPGGSWATIDAADGADLEQRVHAWLGDLAPRVRLARRGNQLVLRAERIDGEAAARATDAVASALVPGLHAPPARLELPCPARGLVDSCSGARWRVESLRLLLTAVAAAAVDPVLVDGHVSALRLAADVRALGLVAGDEIVAVSDHPITSETQLHEVAAVARVHAVLGIRRGGAVGLIDLIEE